MNTITDYEKQAQDFLEKTRTTFKAEYVRYGHHFDDDTDSRDIYQIKLTRMGRSFTFQFGQSVASSLKNEPVSAYSVLACLTKSDPGTLQDFCDNYDGDPDSIKTNKLYKAVCKEWQGVNRMFGDVLQKLMEID